MMYNDQTVDYSLYDRASRPRAQNKKGALCPPRPRTRRGGPHKNILAKFMKGKSHEEENERKSAQGHPWS